MKFEPLYMFSRPLMGEESQMNPFDPNGRSPFQIMMYGAPPPPEETPDLLPQPPISPYQPPPLPYPFQIPRSVDAAPVPPDFEKPATRREVLASSEATRAALRELEEEVKVMSTRVKILTSQISVLSNGHVTLSELLTEAHAALALQVEMVERLLTESKPKKQKREKRGKKVKK